VHWHGWGKRYDEWIHADRLMPKTAENEELMHRTNAEAKAQEQQQQARSRPASKHHSGTPSAKSAKRKDEPAKARPEPDRSLKLPFTLKKLLVDDWEFVTMRACLVRFPKQGLVGERPRKRPAEADTVAPAPKRLKPTGDAPSASSATSASAAPMDEVPSALTVQDILQQFLESRGTPDAADRELVQGECGRTGGDEMANGTVAGLLLYFDRCLSCFLLYKFERQQLKLYLATRPPSDKRCFSQLYGAEHLLRLFVKLPVLLGHAKLPLADLATLEGRLESLIGFLDSNRERLFTRDYVRASASYVHEAQSRVFLPWRQSEASSSPHTTAAVAE
jgi:mortality factor 4-like protein 1